MPIIFIKTSCIPCLEIVYTCIFYLCLCLKTVLHGQKGSKITFKRGQLNGFLKITKSFFYSSTSPYAIRVWILFNLSQSNDVQERSLRSTGFRRTVSYSLTNRKSSSQAIKRPPRSLLVFHSLNLTTDVVFGVFNLGISIRFFFA